MKFCQIPSLMLISAIALSAALGSDEFQLMRDEAIGALKVGLPREQAIQIVGASPKAGRIEEWGIYLGTARANSLHMPLDFKSNCVRDRALGN